jgi:hypothetical protein
MTSSYFSALIQAIKYYQVHGGNKQGECIIKNDDYSIFVLANHHFSIPGVVSGIRSHLGTRIDEYSQSTF